MHEPGRERKGEGLNVTLLIATSALSQALLGCIPQSMTEAFVVVHENSAPWKLVIAFDQDNKVNREIFDDIASELFAELHNFEESEHAKGASQFEAEFRVYDVPTIILPSGGEGSIQKAFAYRKMSTELYDEFANTPAD